MPKLDDAGPGPGVVCALSRRGIVPRLHRDAVCPVSGAPRRRCRLSLKAVPPLPN
jgi:hypothetical protein